MTKTTIVCIAVAGLFFAGLDTAAARGGGRDNDRSDDRSDDRVRLRCSSRGAGDFSMDAKFETRRGRTKFDTSFEAAPGIGFFAGDRLTVMVGGQTVGEITLVEKLNGDLDGDLDFDTTAQSDDDDLPLPSDFPDVGIGTSVVVGPLGCDL